MIETLMNIAIAERAKASMNLNIYLSSGVAIGEHPDIVGEANKLVDEFATADGKVQALNGMIDELKALDEEKNKA